MSTVLSQDWVQDARQRGALIQILSRNARLLHADDGLAERFGASHLKPNGFDMIPAETAGEASGIIARFAATQTPVVVRFPIRGDLKGLQWFRFEVRWPQGLIALAVWPEEDPQHHRISVEPLSG